MAKWDTNRVTPRHFERAAAWIDKHGLPKGFRRGRVWEVEVGSRWYPPKAICSLANSFAPNGRALEPSEFGGISKGAWHGPPEGAWVCNSPCHW